MVGLPYTDQLYTCISPTNQVNIQYNAVIMIIHQVIEDHEMDEPNKAVRFWNFYVCIARER